jgi:hypothetical protein
MASAKPLMYLSIWNLPMAKPLPHHKRFRGQWEMPQWLGDWQSGVGAAFTLQLQRRIGETPCALSTSLRASAKQSMSQQADSWIASSLSLLAMTSRHNSAISPHVSREVCFELPPYPIGGRGEAGRPMRPIAACATGSWVERTRVSQVTPESPGTPRAMVYSL